MAKQNIVLSKKMVQKYEQKIINGGFKRLMSEEIGHQRLLDEAEKVPVEETEIVVEDANEG